MVSAIALTAPAANNVVNLLFFIFVLCFVKRMLSVVHLSDCSKLEFIQPHSLFVIGGSYGCLQVGTLFRSVRLIDSDLSARKKSDASGKRPYL